MEPTTSELLSILASRMCDAEAAIRRIEKLRDAVADDADGQWGIGDIILAAEKVETRKASKPGASPFICAWLDDPEQARSLARFVGETARFDEFTETFSVTFEATRVI